jgi:hypothetical protein
MRQKALPLDVLPPSALLESEHYLGRSTRGKWTYQDEFGVMVWANPTSRRLPQTRWLELVRWCLLGQRNGGSTQWGRVRKIILVRFPDVTTLVSYSDPSVGHTGALYKACNWTWAPTWHRLKPPPSGNGSWGAGKAQSVKDRWVFPLRPDVERAEILRVKG